ncbi:anti-phage dCTP deaminase [Paraburkholderia phenoliruptrix]|uniref:anti-phage dCTP deaminase n=1 Tax=Paraburkholderia phenoliruptrix TaxID=252970 RepID=UPI002869A138|nr:anti-phage dCTP deaminase [Paraburkholderia phenoliruptrix]WMY11314.1 anti-phage dCTP deaminase [Paraburkholderia phenoliruptrix]
MRNNLAVVASQLGRGTRERLDDQGTIDKSRTPEVVIALCGPMGTPLHEVAQMFKSLLHETDYSYSKVDIIRLSNEICRLSGIKKEECSTKDLIEAGNELRRDHGNAVLARVAIRQITLEREKLNEEDKTNDHVEQQMLFPDAEFDRDVVRPTVSERRCHIIDSIKHIDELRLLRSVYGDMLHVVGVYTPIELRVERLARRTSRGDDVYGLIDRDSGEELDYGQRVQDTFPLSDFFLRADKNTDSELRTRGKRFLDLMLGTRIMTPTVHERAMYAAYSAARNSACLSRQVGAALTNKRGSVISVGWNDVPRPFGGLYETADVSDSPDGDHRCWNVDGGRCFNDSEKSAIAEAVVSKMVGKGIIEPGKRDEAYALMRHDTQLKSLIEFSRAVHAEMHALLSAGATHGGEVQGGKLFVTTYPCHSCARHIVAAGIEEVYFLEPYRKSLATKLHSDAITARETDKNKVRIVPFDGVAPSRFLKFFSSHETGRKDSNSGQMKIRAAYPVTAITLEAIPTLEALAVRELQSSGLDGDALSGQRRPPEAGGGDGHQTEGD